MEDEINVILQRMVAHGLIGAFKKWSLHLMRISDALRFPLAEKNTPISLEHIAGLFYGYLIGIVISFIVLVCEIVANNFKRDATYLQ